MPCDCIGDGCFTLKLAPGFIMNVQPITISDIDSIRALQPLDWPDIIPHIKIYIQSSFCFPLKFIDSDILAGTGTLILHENSAWLAHIIVSPEFRNRGIGLYIVNTLLNHPEAIKKKTKLLIATKLGEPVYLKAGFRTVSIYRFFKRDTEIEDYSPIQEIIDIKEEHFTSVLEMDSYGTGEQRAQLIKQYLFNGKVYFEGGQIKGFYLPGLGEGLIVAGDKTAGQELMQYRSSVKNTFVVPEENKTAITFLKENAFTEVSQGKRMILGEDIQWNPQHMYSRIGGNLG